MSNRTHSQIVQDVGVTALREKLATLGILVSDPTVRSWPRRGDGAGSIPAEYWQPLADLGVATLEELAAAKAQGLIGEQADAA